LWGLHRVRRRTSCCWAYLAVVQAKGSSKNGLTTQLARVRLLRWDPSL
jgi:hypothetical protein